ncbi:hypothetical protein BDV06DRAFT_227100 [Aspergillus oleicola]
MHSRRSTQRKRASSGHRPRDESLEQGAKFFVSSSVNRGGEHSLNNPTAVPHFIYKHEIEKHLIAKTKGNSMRWSILRPTAIFENLTPDYFGKVFATTWKMSLKGMQC